MDVLQAVVGEVEAHVAEAGWDQPPQLFALVDTEQLLRAEPQLAATMGIVVAGPGSLTPVAQDPLADGPLDEVLAGIEFGPDVLGVVLAHEVLVLPPSAERALADPATQNRAPQDPAAQDPAAQDPAAQDPAAQDPAAYGVDLATATAHPDAREVRMAVGVLRDGSRSAVLRLRAPGDAGTDDRLTGPDLVPALAEALLTTLSDAVERTG